MSQFVEDVARSGPQGRWKALVQKHVLAGKSIPAAVRLAAQEDPELHAAYIASANAGRVSGRAGGAVPTQVTQSGVSVGWKGLVQKYVSAGKSNATAVRLAAKEDPELHAAYIASANAA